MQCWISVAKLCLLGAVALAVISCGASPQSGQSGAAQSSNGDPVEDSGERLSGDFDLSSLEDAYRAKSVQAQPKTIFSFDDVGNFKRQEKPRIDEGTYLIGAGSELVIYIEKVNGEPLAAARVERYVIAERRRDSITLQSGPSRRLILRKR
ncbi:MAG: hypothetical protein AABN34_14955 [Acidobacteriota bacterium]